jgi:hypothetical protein
LFKISYLDGKDAESAAQYAHGFSRGVYKLKALAGHRMGCGKTAPIPMRLRMMTTEV